MTFWKIFAWINAVINVPFVIAALLVTPVFHALDVAVWLFNDFPLLAVPFLFAYKVHGKRYIPALSVLEAVLVFSITYNTIHIISDLKVYHFTSIPGFLFDLSFHIFIILSLISFLFYIKMERGPQAHH